MDTIFFDRENKEKHRGHIQHMTTNRKETYFADIWRSCINYLCVVLCWACVAWLPILFQVITDFGGEGYWNPVIDTLLDKHRYLGRYQISLLAKISKVIPLPDPPTLAYFTKQQNKQQKQLQQQQSLTTHQHDQLNSTTTDIEQHCFESKILPYPLPHLFVQMEDIYLLRALKIVSETKDAYGECVYRIQRNGHVCTTQHIHMYDLHHGIKCSEHGGVAQVF